MWSCGGAELPSLIPSLLSLHSEQAFHQLRPACGARASTMRLTCLRKGRDSERYVVSSQPAGRRLLRRACPVLSSTSTYGPWNARHAPCSRDTHAPGAAEPALKTCSAIHLPACTSPELSQTEHAPTRCAKVWHMHKEHVHCEQPLPCCTLHTAQRCSICITCWPGPGSCTCATSGSSWRSMYWQAARRDTCVRPHKVLAWQPRARVGAPGGIKLARQALARRQTRLLSAYVCGCSHSQACTLPHCQRGNRLVAGLRVTTKKIFIFTQRMMQVTFSCPTKRTCGKAAHRCGAAPWRPRRLH